MSPSSLSPSSLSRPESRYGSATNPDQRNRMSGKMLAVLFVVVVVGIVAYLVRMTSETMSTPVTASYVSHERVTDDTLRVWFDVTRKDTSQPVYCIVTALDYDVAEIGRREVAIAPGDDEIERIGADVPTRGLPVAGEVYGCSTTMPSYLDHDNPALTL